MISFQCPPIDGMMAPRPIMSNSVAADCSRSARVMDGDRANDSSRRFIRHFVRERDDAIGRPQPRLNIAPRQTTPVIDIDGS